MHRPSLRSLLLLPALLCIPAQPASSQEDPRSLMLQARGMQRGGGGEPDEAVALYRKVITLVPQSAEAHLRLSEALVESGDMEGAVAPAIKATELDPRNVDAWIHLGMLQFARQKDENARLSCRTALQEASRLLPSSVEVWLQLGQICQSMKDDEGALNAWIRLGRLHPLGTVQGNRPLADVAWELAASLAENLQRYEPRREAIMALCRKNRPEARHLRLLEDLVRTQVRKDYLGHAEESFLVLARHRAGDADLWENIARIQMQTGRFEEALKSLETATSIKETPRTAFFHAVCLMHLGRMKEAERHWKTYFDIEGAQPEREMHQSACFGQAACLLLQDRPGDVLDLIATWTDLQDSSELLSLKVQALIQTQAWKAAQAALQEGVKRFPKQGIFARAGRPPLSKHLEEGFFSKKKSREALMQLDQESMAGLWADYRQWETCLKLVLEIRKASPTNDIDVLLMHANALEQLDRSGESLAIYREAQKLKPEDPMLQNNLGYLLLEKGDDLDEAARLIAASLKQNPKDPSTLDSWGCVLLKQGKLEEAEATIRKAVDLRPYNPDIRKHLGEALLALKRPEEALEQWERALAFAFPERKELEDRARKLRVDLAKQGRHPEAVPDEESEEPEDADTEGEAEP